MRTLTSIVSAACLAFLLSPSAGANNWVCGTVTSLEDYGSFTVDSNPVLVGLNVSNWIVPADAATCNQRFRIVTGLQNVTEPMKNRFFALLLSAYHTGSQVRLFYSTTGAPIARFRSHLSAHSDDPDAASV